jgi:hypothetical protein
VHQLKPAVVRVLGGSPKPPPGKGIYAVQDFTVGLFDSTGKTISVGIGLPMFIGGLSDALKSKIDHFGPDGSGPATSCSPTSAT